MAGNGIWLKILLTSALALTILPLTPPSPSRTDGQKERQLSQPDRWLVITLIYK